MAIKTDPSPLSRKPNYPLRISGAVMATVKRAADREETSTNKMIETLLREALRSRNMRIIGATKT